jgi:hypothetical protein
MPVGNGGIIGVVNAPTSLTATGVWSLQEQFDAIKNISWPSRNISVQYFVAGGGGGGGSFQGGVTWGEGGSGGFVSTATALFELAVNYTVTVGGGGAGSNTTSGSTGSSSVFAFISAAGGPGGRRAVALGGKGLGNINNPVGSNSWFGGVGTTDLVSVLLGGGGTFGNANSGRPSGPADDGIDFGGGWAYQAALNLVLPPANRSGGGAGAYNNGIVGQTGGSGKVIIKYSDARTCTVGAGLTSSETSAGGFKTRVFTAGTGTISFS